jgi:hypothetical protein
MRFPDKLTVGVRERGTGVPVQGVAIILVLFAARKNDYYVGPLITSENGRVDFTRAECETAIKRAQEMFIMDYSGDLEGCRPVIDVRLHSPEQIEAMLEQYKQSPDFWGAGFSDPKHFFADLQNVRNAKYKQAQVTATEKQIVSHPQLELLLEEK